MIQVVVETLCYTTCSSSPTIQNVHFSYSPHRYGMRGAVRWWLRVRPSVFDQDPSRRNPWENLVWFHFLVLLATLLASQIVCFLLLPMTHTPRASRGQSRHTFCRLFTKIALQHPPHRLFSSHILLSGIQNNAVPKASVHQRVGPHIGHYCPNQNFLRALKR